MGEKWYSKALAGVMIVLLAALLPVLVAPPVSAASAGYATLTWNVSKGSWQNGNAGTLPEGALIGTEVIITNTSSTPLTLGEIDFRFSFYDSSSKSIGIDYVNNFYYSTSTSFAAGSTTHFPYDPTTLGATNGWNSSPGTEPYIVNMPWTGTIGDVTGSESQTSPASNHFWGINPADLLSNGTLSPGQSLAIYFEPHLAYSFIWQNGKEGPLPINGSASGGVTINRSGWTAAYNGAGFFPGSKLHGNLECATTGEKTIQLPAVSQVNGSIAGFKINDANWNGKKDQGEVGLAGWPITLTATIDSTQISIVKNTAADGGYSFTNLPDLTFSMSEPQAGYNGYVPTNGQASIQLTLPLPSGTGYGSAGSRTATNVNFYNHVKGTPVITWNNPADITYGTALSSTQLNATASFSINGQVTQVTGTFVYTPASGVVLNAGGGQNLHVDFTPTDMTNYNNASKDVKINVNKATPVVTWSNPADIAYGTPLGGTQLNATASWTVNGSPVTVPGTFVYTPAAGVVLNAGAGQNLHMDFTPTDATNYNSVSMDAKINVVKASPVFSNLSSQTIKYGNTPTPLTGTIKAGSVVPAGNISITINGATQSTAIDAQGNFSCNFATGSISAGTSSSKAYTVTYSYAGDADFNSASDSSTTLTVKHNPPVASFDFSPSQLQQPLESATVQLTDHSSTPDPGGVITSWQWTVTKDGNPSSVASANWKNPFLVPPDNGTYNATLTVMDSFGDSSTAIASLVITNAPPKVKALDVEVLPGRQATLVGRFLDPGWLDRHTATWSLTGPNNVVLTPAATVQEDHVALMGTGIVTGTITLSDPPGTVWNGTLTVTDKDGGVASTNFTVTVVANDPALHEPDDTIGGAPKVTNDSVLQSFIGTPGDIDISEVTGSDGSALPAGSEVLATLTNLPADYDLVIVTPQSSFQTAGFLSGGFQSGGFLSGGFQSGGFLSGGFQSGGFLSGGFQSGGFQSGGITKAGFLSGGFQSGGFLSGGFQSGGFLSGNITFSQYPLSQLGFTGQSANSIGGADVNLGELGLGALASQNVTVLGVSANRGLTDERLLIRTSYSGERVFVVVVGANGAVSSEPYTLQIEKSIPMDISQWLSTSGFSYNIFSSPLNYSTDTPASLYDFGTNNSGAAPQTLFVTQKDRMIAVYGQSAWDTLFGKLTTLADNSAVRGDIISVPISIYQSWDSKTSSVDAANNVASQIRSVIQQQLGTHQYQYVVIVGDDDIIPFYRVTDQTAIGNERDYTSDSFTEPGSPLFSSLQGGFILTDDYYVSQQSTSPQGQPVYIPDLPVSRLVETPAEIGDLADAFLSSNGALNASSALVTGYDFFADGAQAEGDQIAKELLNINYLISDGWTANDLRNLFLGATPHSIDAVNAHFTHYAALSAAGFKGTASQNAAILTSGDVASVTNNVLKNSIVFTMGCHAGLNVPDQAAPNGSDIGLSVNPQLDFPQAMARQSAIYIASTGYGLGDDQGIAGTERLMVIFTKDLLGGGTTVGSALVQAKRDYLMSLSTLTEYDVKSSIEFTLYGLPQFSVSLPSTAQQPTSTAVGSNYASNTLNLTVDGTTTMHALQPYDTTWGTYFGADGNNTQNTAFHAIQPEIVQPLNQTGGPVHGALLTGGSFTDITSFDPVISRPTFDWDLNAAETQTAPSSFWPPQLGTVNTLSTGSGLLQSLIVIPAQFCPDYTTAPGGNITGTERIYNGLNLTLLRSTSTDWTPPAVNSVSILSVGTTSVTVAVNATDASGISQIVVLSLRGGQIISTSLTVSGQSGPYTLSVPYVAGDRLIVEVADGAGNITTATGKGATFRPISVDAGPDQHFTPGAPVSFTATITGFDSLVKPVSYVWDFGDGHTASGQLTSGSLTVSHTYDWSAPQRTTTLKVTDADGGVGSDTALATINKVSTTVGVSASLSNLIVGQPVTITAAVMANTANLTNTTGMPMPTGTVQFQVNGANLGPPVILSGGSASVSTSSLPAGSPGITAIYSGDSYFSGGMGALSQPITVIYTFGGFLSPIPGSQYNLGRTVPVKFALTDYKGVSVGTAVANLTATDSAGTTVVTTVPHNTSGSQYQYNLDTSGFQTGTLTLTVSLDDQTTHSEQIQLR